MLDAWLKSKFYAKCKSTIRHTKIRIEMVKNKRNAMQKYLKNDIADLLKTGLDVNAYSRAEGLLAELNISRCYDLLEQYCDHISNNLGIMYKQRDCPAECREAVSSLIFAAARFADVPELRQLRSVFTDRYGNFLECYVSKEFLHNIKAEPPTKEMKLQLMKDIASEAGIEWNSKALELKLYNPLVSEQQDLSKSQNDEKHKLHNKMYGSASKKDAIDSRKIVPDDHEHRLPMIRESDRCERDTKFDASPPVKDIIVDSTRIEVKQDKPEVDSIVHEEESDGKKPSNYSTIPAPYTRSKVSITKNSSDASPTSSSPVEENYKDDTVEKARSKPRSTRTRCGTKVTSGDDKECEDDEEKLLDRLLMHFSRKRFQNVIKKPESVKKPEQAAADNSTSEVPKKERHGQQGNIPSS